MSANPPIVDFMLPGRWWRVGLDSDQQLRRSAKAMAVKAIGRSDEVASLRAELVEHVTRAAMSARTAHGSEFYFGLEIAPGLPLPMSLTVYWPALPSAPSRVAGGGVAAETLAQSLTATGRGQVEVIDSESFGIVRVVDTNVAPVAPRHADASQTSHLGVSYWIVNPQSAHTLLLSFSTALAHLHDAVLEFSDAIVSSVMWREGEHVRRG